MHKLQDINFNKKNRSCGTGVSGDPDSVESVQTCACPEAHLQQSGFPFFCPAKAAPPYKKSVCGGGQILHEFADLTAAGTDMMFMP